MNKRILLQGIVGSQAYGTNTQDSDVDIMGVYLADRNYYLGVYNVGDDFFETKIPYHYPFVVLKDPAKYYELKKFVKLCLDFNPNVIPFLFLKNFCFFDPIVGELYNHRNKFLSNKVYKTFIGYAIGQEKRMLGETTGQLGDKRKNLINQFGYDTKYAMHTVRLLKMAIEILTTKKVNVFREDASELLNIRNGNVPLNILQDYIKHLKQLAEESYKKTDLPDSPNYDFINNLVVKIIYDNI